MSKRKNPEAFLKLHREAVKRANRLNVDEPKLVDPTAPHLVSPKPAKTGNRSG